MLCTNVLIIQIFVALAATINGENIQITTYRKMADVKPSDIERITTNYDCTCTVSKSFMGIKVCVKKDLKSKIKFDDTRIKNVFFFRDMYLKYSSRIVITGRPCKEFNFPKSKSNDTWKIMQEISFLKVDFLEVDAITCIGSG